MVVDFLSKKYIGSGSLETGDRIFKVDQYKIAVEMEDNTIPYFHKTQEDFIKQVERDREVKRLLRL